MWGANPHPHFPAKGESMDLRVRKFVLYKIQNKEKNRRKLEQYKSIRKAMRQDIIDESSGEIDGQPRGKGKTGDVTQRKALRLIDLDNRIERMEKDLMAIDIIEKKINRMGDIAQDIYTETMKKTCTDLTAKAQLIGIGRRQLIEGRARLLEMFATEMGEYIDIDKM